MPLLSTWILLFLWGFTNFIRKKQLKSEKKLSTIIKYFQPRYKPPLLGVPGQAVICGNSTPLYDCFPRPGWAFACWSTLSRGRLSLCLPVAACLAWFFLPLPGNAI